jgi:hypothetical protein
MVNAIGSHSGHPVADDAASLQAWVELAHAVMDSP